MISAVIRLKQGLQFVKHLFWIFDFVPNLALLRRDPFGPTDRSSEPPIMKALGLFVLAWIQLIVACIGGFLGFICYLNLQRHLELDPAVSFIVGCIPLTLLGAVLLLLPLKLAIALFTR